MSPTAPTARPRVNLARNLFSTVASQLLSWGMTFAVTLFLPRYAGDTGLGKMALAGAFMAIFSVLVPLGTSTVLVKEIARNHDRTGPLVLASLALRIPLGLLSTLIIVALALVLRMDRITQQIVLASALSMTLGSVCEALASALQGLERLPRQNMTVLIERTLSSGAMVGLIWVKAPLWALAGVGTLTGLVVLGMHLAALRSHLPLSYLLQPRNWPKQAAVIGLARAGVPYLTWNAFKTLYGQTDPIVLRLLTNDATVGWYAAAFRLIGTTLFLPTAVTGALFPTLTRLYTEDRPAFERLGRQVFGLIMLMAVPTAVILLLLPEQILRLLHYPPGFAGSILVLRVGGVSAMAYFLGCALGTLVIASDGQAAMMRASVGAALVGVPACFLLTWAADRLLHNGAVGAMASDVLLEGYLLFVYLRAAPFRPFDQRGVQQALRCTLASLPMAAVLWAGAAAGPVASWSAAVLACILYVGLCAVGGGIDRHEAATLLGGALRRRGSAGA